jgi:hypothetical protein
VFAAATAGRPFAAGWAAYRQRVGWVWQGRVAEVIAAWEGRQAELGAPEEGEPETSPRQVVGRTLTYLRNHQDKMRYDDYRRQGLPITGSHVESVVKQINHRVKGTEKFWSEGGPRRCCNSERITSVMARRWRPSGNGGKRRRPDNAATAEPGSYRPCRAPGRRGPDWESSQFWRRCERG